MKQEILEIAKQYKNDCDNIEAHDVNQYHYLLVKKDGSVEYRRTLPYVVSNNVESFVVINQYGYHQISSTGFGYTSWSAQSLCLSDEGDSESLYIDGWSIKFHDIRFIWDQGDWPIMNLQKEDMKYELLFRSYEAVANNWHIVKLFMGAEGPKHLDLLLKPYFDEHKIVKNANEYKILQR